jgi:hypothetical protein
MAPKDVRQDEGGAGGGGGTGTGGAAAGKRTLTQGIVQKKDSLGFEPEPKWKMPDGGLPKGLQPVEPTEINDDITRFRRALEGGNREAAMNAWNDVNPAARIRWSEGATIERELQQIKRVLGTYLLQIMHDAGLTFAARPALLREIIADKSAANNWLAGLARHVALWNDFLETLPDRDAMTEAEGKQIGKIILTHDDLGVVKKLFGYVYAPLSDSAYDPDIVRTRPWKLEWIHRLYNTISSHLPLQHVRTVKDFAIGYEEKERTATTWKPLDYAWWSGSRHVILNESSAKQTRVSKNDTNGGKSTPISHFDGSALHEVGHGVGQLMGGNDWAMAHPYVGWRTSMSEDEWSKGLWGSDGDMKERVRAKLGDKGNILDASEARKYMAHKITGKDYAVTTPGFDRARDVEAFIRKHWADQKLTRYWERVLKSDKKDVYKFTGDANVGDDDRAYVYLTRADNTLCSYNAEAHRKRVSDYSTSSPLEWFAEQYEHYYRGTPRGAGIEAATKTKLDELHGQKFRDPDALMRPGEGEAAGDKAGLAAGADDRQPFPW